MASLIDTLFGSGCSECRITPEDDVNYYHAVDAAREKITRKETPIFSGVIAYFPDAIKEVARCSWVGNEQHHPNTPIHWDREKSTDEPDALLRHLTDHASGVVFDTDGVRHLAKVAWRALAFLQKELENDARSKYASDVNRPL